MILSLLHYRLTLCQSSVWFLWVFLCVGLCSPGVCSAGNGIPTTNIAFGKKYTVAPGPNYSLTAKVGGAPVLTDGQHTRGHFWSSQTTIGWAASGAIEVLIDLEKSFRIEKILVNTARGDAAQVHYPAAVYAFVGPDLEHLSYVGDVANDNLNVSGGYEVRKFALKTTEAMGRYIVLQIVPKGHFFFCDEIEVLGHPGNSHTIGIITLADSRRWQAWPFLFRELDKLQANCAKTAEGVKKCNAFRDSKRASMGSPRNIFTFVDELMNLRAELLRPLFPGKITMIEEADTWASFSPTAFPLGAPLESLSFSLPTHGYDVKSLAITNLDREPRTYEFAISIPGGSGVRVTAQEVEFVKGFDSGYVADRLLPLDQKITLRPGESRMVMLSVVGTQAGIYKGLLLLKGKEFSHRVPIEMKVFSATLEEPYTLSTLNYAYLNRKSVERSVEQFVADLKSHHITTVVVPPDLLPPLDQNGRGDFNDVYEYLRSHKGFVRVIFFLGYNLEHYRTAKNRLVFMDGRWQEAFRRWNEGLLKAAERAGYSIKQVYLFPFDEMHGKDIERFEKFAGWLKKEVPAVQLYATIYTKDSLRAVRWLDVAQIIDRDEMLNKLVPAKTEFWLYDAEGPGRALAPYSYYRLLHWKAFYRDFRGTGFWNYADFEEWGKGRTSTDQNFAIDYAVRRNYYAVIYEGKSGEIVSSRRWEAWRVGVEDYEILRMYARKMGDSDARKLAQYVLERRRDTKRADEVRRKILIELSELKEKEEKGSEVQRRSMARRER